MSIASLLRWPQRPRPLATHGFDVRFYLSGATKENSCLPVPDFDYDGKIIRERLTAAPPVIAVSRRGFFDPYILRTREPYRRDVSNQLSRLYKFKLNMSATLPKLTPVTHRTSIPLIPPSLAHSLGLATQMLGNQCPHLGLLLSEPLFLVIAPVVEE